MTDEVLHAFTRVLLRFCSPQRAFTVVTRVGGLLPPHGDGADVRRARVRVSLRGTCLSRALAVAARAPDAEVVIGVTPQPGCRLFAHAWLELAGQPIDTSDVAGREIARIKRSGPSRVATRTVIGGSYRASL